MRVRQSDYISQAEKNIKITQYRTQLFNPQDMPNVEKVRAGYKVQSLSVYLKQPAPAKNLD
jgi:hypothetical protein